jgi:Haem-binding domain
VQGGLKVTLVLLGIAVLAIQFVPSRVTNPTSKGEISAPPEVEATLRRSCFDCHSNQTQWPWYRHIAPISWEVARDIELGRRQVNFSEWGEYYPSTRRRKLLWVRRALQQEDMPPRSYQLIHPTSRLSPETRAQLQHWIDAEVGAIDSTSR